MRDWIAIVRQNLKDLDLPTEQEQQVIQELAAHLEDLYHHHRRGGASDSEAFRFALEEAVGLKTTRRRIRRAKCEEKMMNARTKTLWLPALATLFASSILLMVLQQFVYLRPRLWFKDGGILVVHLPWLLLLPFCGALGAYLSQRAGGKHINSLFAGLFPSAVMLAVFCALFPIGVLIEKNAFLAQHPVYFFLGMLDWTVLPAVPLFLGVAAVWRIMDSRRPLAISQ